MRPPIFLMTFFVLTSVLSAEDAVDGNAELAGTQELEDEAEEMGSAEMTEIAGTPVPVRAVDKIFFVDAAVPEFKTKNTKSDRIIISKRKQDKELDKISDELVPSISDPYFYEWVKVVRNRRLPMKPPEITRTQESNAKKRKERRDSKAPEEKEKKESSIERRLREDDEEKRKEFLEKLHKYNALPVEYVRPHAAAKNFPGAVPDSATRVAMTYTSNNEIRGWQCTGAYAPPGETIRVHVAKAGVNSGYKIRIGAHTENLEGGTFDNRWERFPFITREFGVGNDTISIANPFGGMIYVWAPQAVKKKIVSSSQARVPKQVRFRFVGVVDAPFYAAGKTKAAEWAHLRNAPAPWGQVEGKYFKALVPAVLLRDLKDPKALVDFWDDVIVYLDKAVGRKKPLEEVEYVIFDVDSNTVGGHAGQNIVLPLDDAENFANLESLKKDGYWPLFFYLAKNRLDGNWTLYGNADAAASLLAMCCMKEFTERPLGDFIDIAALQTWAHENPRRSHTPELVGMYAPLLEKFGTEAFLNVLADFRKSAKANIKTEVERADVFIITWSKHAKMNLGPYFDGFGFKYNPQVVARVNKLPEFRFDFANSEKKTDDGWIGAFPSTGIAQYFSDYNPPLDMTGRTKYAAGTPEEIELAESKDFDEDSKTQLDAIFGSGDGEEGED
ncbi:MAG: M60 family metallopeptidase [Opitutales bacterium]|nr:M60 family metallopeptidase [Opitutales bacterium]